MTDGQPISSAARHLECSECPANAARWDDDGRPLCLKHFRVYADARFAAVRQFCRRVLKARQGGTSYRRDKYGRTRVSRRRG